MKAPNLNDEAEAQGRKEAGAINHPIYAITPPEGAPSTGTLTSNGHNGHNGSEVMINGRSRRAFIFVESGRWFDARAFGVRYYGVPEVVISPMKEAEPLPLPRWQLRWVGNTNGNNPLRVQARLIEYEGQVKRWRDIRDVAL